MSHNYQLLEMNTTNGGMHRRSQDVKGNIHHLKYTKITKRRISTIAVMKVECQSHQLKQFIIQGQAYPLNTYMSTIFHTEQLKSHEGIIQDQPKERSSSQLAMEHYMIVK